MLIVRVLRTGAEEGTTAAAGEVVGTETALETGATGALFAGTTGALETGRRGALVAGKDAVELAYASGVLATETGTTGALVAMSGTPVVEATETTGTEVVEATETAGTAVVETRGTPMVEAVNLYAQSVFDEAHERTVKVSSAVTVWATAAPAKAETAMMEKRILIYLLFRVVKKCKG